MIAILPGSYDPITKGHLEIIKRASREFDEVYVVAFINPKKEYFFSAEDRLLMLSLATKELKNVYTDFSSGLVIDYMNEKGIDLIVKGYRNDDDLAYEREQAEWNLKNGGYETVFIKCDEGYEGISSTEARLAIARGDDTSAFLTPEIAEFVKKH